MPVELYGQNPEFLKGARQSEIELLLAFKEKIHNPDSEAARQWLGRYEHLRRAIDLIWNIPRREEAIARRLDYDVRKHDAFFWNDWSEDMIEAFSEWRWSTVVTGPNACVAGETRILNPITGKSPTIAELREKRIAPIVMTLYGAEQAGVPFIKGVAELYEVRLSDGSKFRATAEHRVLTENGYERVGSLAIGSRLFGYAQSRPDSNLDSGLLAHARDAHDSQKTVGDSRDDCRPVSRFDDEQLPQEAGISLSFSPSLGGALEHIPPCLHEGVLARAGSRTPRGLQFDRPSSFHCAQGGRRCAYPTSHYSRLKTLERADDWLLSSSRYDLSARQREPSAKPVSRLIQPHSDVSYPAKIRMLAVVSIIWSSKESYYDITVPKAEHYFAEGLIHHNSSKTTSAAVYNLAAWYASPTDTICVLTSTSLPGLRKRIWKEILKFHRLAAPGFGHVNASEFAIRLNKGSDEAGIFGIATGQDEGDIQKAVDKIIGFHAKKVVATVDEGQATNEAIKKACSSLEAGSERFQLIMLGNADSELDPHGQEAEPLNGWDSITPEAERWETKRGICIHLDGLQSPRVKEGDEFYPGLLTKRDIDNEAKAYGEDSPEFWRTRRGFWAPQGVTKTIWSPVMIRKFRAREKAIWVSGYEMGAGLDPAFEGGDRCILRFGKCGEFSVAPYEEKGALVGIEFTEIVPIKVSATSNQPVHYQIVDLVRAACEQRGVGPEMLALDASGEGGGLASIFQREWSPAVTLIEFGGRASEMPVSEHNPKPSSQEYVNRVTELWYQSRVMLQNGQIRGLDQETAVEFCSRLYDSRGNMKIVESKTIMKARTKRSPDLADAAVVLLELFRQKKSIGLAGGSVPSIDEGWRKFVRKNNMPSEDAYLIEA